LAPTNSSSSEGEESDYDKWPVIYSAGDEKIVRTFEAPSTLLAGVQALCGIDLRGGPKPVPVDTSNNAAKTKAPTKAKANAHVTSAYIPELGLSNKAADQMSGEEAAEFNARGVGALKWDMGLPPMVRT
jgi:hypothetical protein